MTSHGTQLGSLRGPGLGRLDFPPRPSVRIAFCGPLPSPWHVPMRPRHHLASGDRIGVCVCGGSHKGHRAREAGSRVPWPRFWRREKADRAESRFGGLLLTGLVPVHLVHARAGGVWSLPFSPQTLPQAQDRAHGPPAWRPGSLLQKQGAESSAGPVDSWWLEGGGNTGRGGPPSTITPGTSAGFGPLTRARNPGSLRRGWETDQDLVCHESLTPAGLSLSDDSHRSVLRVCELVEGFVTARGQAKHPFTCSLFSEGTCPVQTPS